MSAVGPKANGVYEQLCLCEVPALLAGPCRKRSATTVGKRHTAEKCCSAKNVQLEVVHLKARVKVTKESKGRGDKTPKGAGTPAALRGQEGCGCARRRSSCM